MATYTREQIIAAIQQATAHDGGNPPGRIRFETLTGMTPRAWQGVYWARWGDALREAGLEPNAINPALDQDQALLQVADMVRRLGKLPTDDELRMARRSDPTLPSPNSLRLLGGRRSGRLVEKLRALAESDSTYADILDLLPEPAAPTDDADDTLSLPAPPAVTGQVYLMRKGKSRQYKVGLTRSLSQRIYDLDRHNPEPVTPVHVLQTDDPEGIEAYWKKRFKDRGKLLKNEWFLLSREDVAAFKRRGRFM